MSPRARFSDIGGEVLEPVAALARPAGTPPVRIKAANDTVATGRIDILARRRRRQNRFALRA
ncbi:MAG: hypothetical protein MUE84_01805 [Hyphomonas sp.]|nr:hypothetical protein [Hyphomonas sp.]